jgi:ribosomal protein S1
MSTELPPSSADETVDSPAPTEAVVTSAPASDETPSTTAAGGNAPLTFADLKPKMQVQGKVKRVELQGAIIDVGLEHDGLLHISQLRADPVKNVTDVVKEGEAVTAYILAVDAKKGRLDLTLIPMPEVSWNEIRVDQTYTGTVERIEKYGVFVNIGTERPGLIHVSELSKSYVTDPNEVVKVGDSIQAKVIGINKKKRQIDLSIKALEMGSKASKEEIADEEEVVFATAMEIALRRAMGNDAPPPISSKQDKKRKKREQDSKQADIIARTLQFNRGG